MSKKIHLYIAGIVATLAVVTMSVYSMVGAAPAGGANLQLTLTDSPDPVFIGSTLTYTVTVKNMGPDTATGVKFVIDSASDPLFEGAPNFDGDACTWSEDLEKSCTYDAPLLKGASYTTTIAGTVAAGAPDPMVITAHAASAIASFSEVTASTAIATPRANLGLSISDDPDPVAVGEPLTYTFVVKNFGPDAATGVRFVVDSATDSLYDGAPTIVGCSWSEDLEKSCQFPGTLLAGESFTGTVTGDVAAAAPAVLEIAAHSLSKQVDSHSQNDSATESTKVVQGTMANLGLTISDSPDSVAKGALLTYTIVVKNNGPATASGVKFAVDSATDPLFDGAPTFGGDLCTWVDKTETSPASCTYAGSLSKGQSFTTTITGKVAALAPAELAIALTASSDITDLRTRNNSSTEKTTVASDRLPTADLGLTITDTDHVMAGETLTYTFTVKNSGPDTSSAPKIVITDYMPEAYTSEPVVQGCTSFEGGTCYLNPILNGQSATATISVVVAETALAKISISAMAKNLEVDPVSRNDEVTETTTILQQPKANLGITLGHSPEPVVVGSDATFTITVTNAGPDLAPGAYFQIMSAPENLFDGAPIFGGTLCEPVENEFTFICTYGDLAAGESVSTTVTGIVSNLINLGTNALDISVGSEVFDAHTQNNTASETFTVN